MYKSGELARRTQVTVKTLHHYDFIGLLKPDHVDPQTGYRYYTADQEGRLKKILALKDLGLSLEQIGHLIDQDQTEGPARDTLQSKQTELREQLRDVQARITRIETFLEPVGDHPERVDDAAPTRTTPENKITEAKTMSGIHSYDEQTFSEFTTRLQNGREVYLPMIFGTTAESTQQTGWLDGYSDQYAYLVDSQPEGECVYAMRRADHRAALWFSLILPSNWDLRFRLLDQSLPNLIEWFRNNDTYRYLFAQLGLDNTPPTVQDAFLPIFLKHGFNTEYRMGMHRPAQLEMPERIPVPEGVVESDYDDEMRDELAMFAHQVYTAEGVSYSLESAQRCVWRDIEDDHFTEAATFLRTEAGELVGAIWWSADEEPYLGEFLVAKACQGRGYGRYLLNKAIRHMTRRYPSKGIRLGTCREWTRARALYESYGFLPDRMYTNLNLPKFQDNP
jgi:DNA-binding transcriptional MerR regulator/GNAT superfamily N-acetyltransferase